MTTTLSNPNTATLGMDGAASLTIVMYGKATIDFTSANDDVWPSFTVTNAQSKTYGPYGINMSVVITALDGSLTYQVNGGVPGFGYDADSNITSLVDGDGNVVSPAGSLTTITTSGSTTLTTVATQRVTLGGTHQLTMPTSPGAVAESFLLILTCAGFTPTWSGVTWLTSSGVAPTLNTVAGKINVLTFVWDNSLPGWLGFMSGSQI